jgi:hypothetical protein
MKDLPPRAYAYKSRTTQFSVFETIVPFDFPALCKRMTLTNTKVSLTAGAAFDESTSPIDDSTLNQSLVTIILPNKVHPAYDYTELEMNIKLESTHSAYAVTVKVHLYLPKCSLESGVITPLQNVPTPG